MVSQSAALDTFTTRDRPPFAAGALIRDVTGERYQIVEPLFGWVDGHGPHWAVVRHVATGRRAVVSLQPLDTFIEEIVP